MLLKEFSLRFLQQHLSQTGLQAKLEEEFRQDLDSYHAQIQKDSLANCQKYLEVLKNHWQTNLWRVLQNWEEPRINQVNGVYVLVLDDYQVKVLNLTNLDWYLELFHLTCRLNNLSGSVHFEFLLDSFKPSEPKALVLVKQIVSAEPDSYLLLNESDTLSLGLEFVGAKKYNLSLSSVRRASSLHWPTDL